MLHFSHPTQFAALAGLALLAGPAAAQATHPAVNPPLPAPVVHAPVTPPLPAAPTPAAAPVIDPQVTALFAQTIAAHQALSALSETMTVSSVGLGPSLAQTITLAYLKPGQAKVAVSASTGPIVQFVSDGKTLTIYVVRDKKYRPQPIPPGVDVVSVVLDQAHALLPRLIGQPAALRELLAQPGVTASLGAPATDTIGAVDTVTATLPAPDGSKATFTFEIGKTDHLLHSLTENAAIVSGGKSQAFTMTETVTALNAAPALTAADFHFTPPAGVTKAVVPAAPAKQTSEPPMHNPHLVPGAKPIAFTAKDLSGKPLTLAQYQGKVVLMDFWATWCGPCVGEMPNVIADYKKYHAQGFDIVGVSLDESRPALAAFISKNQMPWRQVFDGKGWASALPTRYGVRAIPFGLLVGRDGKITAVDVRGPALTEAIKSALAK